MDYRLEISGRVLDVSTAVPGDRCEARQFVVDGRPYSVVRRSGQPNQLVLTVDGEVVEAFVANRARGVTEVNVAGRSFTVIDMDRQVRRRGLRGPATPGEVTPPMPSVVVGLLVQVGDTVTIGQGLVVVSAMKMEVTLKAPADGVVTKLNTSLHAKVVPGDILVEIGDTGGAQT